MSVTNGQKANASTFNNAFLSRTTDSDTTGKVGLKNSDTVSGAHIINAQRAINKAFEGIGTTGEADANINVYSSTNYIANGDSRKTAVEKLDAKAKQLNDDLVDAQNDITSLDTRVTQAESDIASLDNRLDTAETNITSLQSSVSSINTTLTNHGNRLNDLESGNMTISGNKTFSGLLTSQNFLLNGQFSLDSENNNASGSDVVISSFAKPIVRLTNSSLLSVAGLAQQTSRRAVYLQNVTNNVLTIKNNTGSTPSERILIPTGINAQIPNNGFIMLIYDTDLQRWIAVSTFSAGGGGGGGGGGSFNWIKDDANPPEDGLLSKVPVFLFTHLEEQRVLAHITVPDSYIAGTQIFLKNIFIFAQVSGNAFFRTRTYLVKDGYSTTLGSPELSANSQQSLTANTFFKLPDIPLSDSTGKISGTSISTGDSIIIELFRDISSETSGVNDFVYLSKFSCFVKF